MARRILFASFLLGAALLFALLFTSEAQASDCTVEAFSVSPNSPSQNVGTILSLYGRGNCAGGIRASRFNIDGGGFGEDAGAPEQSETWALTAGSHTICFEIAGGNNGDWSAGASSCTTITGVGNNPGGGNASVNGPNIVPDGNCRWYIWFALSGFAPNSTITVTSNYSETVCSTGEVVNSGWTGSAGSTDNNGYLAYAVYHHGTGSYNYTFSDSQGHSVPVSFSTGNTTPPSVNPTSIAPPTTGGNNPTTGNTNPTTGNTNPTNPTTGNPNPVQPSSPTTPLVGSSTPPQGQWVRIVAPLGMSIRRGASTSFPVVARAANGMYLEYVGERSGWYEVRWNGGSGWVSGGSQYTELGGNQPNSPQPSTPNAPSSPSIPQRWCTHRAHAYDAGWDSLGDPAFYLQIPRGAWDGNYDHIRIKFFGVVVSGLGKGQIIQLESRQEDGDYWKFGINSTWAIGQQISSQGIPFWRLDFLWSVEATC